VVCLLLKSEATEYRSCVGFVVYMTFQGLDVCVLL
jgi:hypothetical protein